MKVIMGKHVCFLIAEHPFLDARIFKKEAISLLKKDYKITMIVPRRKGYLFNVDGSLFHNEFRSEQFIHEGIKVITYEQEYPEKKVKSLFANLHTQNKTRFNDKLTKLGIAQNADIYHAHEFYSLYSGIGIKRELSAQGKPIKLIYDSHELEPDPLVKQAKRIKKVKMQMLDYMLKETDYVITVSEAIKAWLKSINPNVSVEVIYNSPRLAPQDKSTHGKKDGLILGFEGVMNHKRGSFSKLMNLLEMCNKKFELKVKIIGGSKASEMELIIPSHLKDKVIHTGWVDYDLIPTVMNEVDVGWVDLDATNSMNNRFAMPNKFFSYLNNGVPVLTNQCESMAEFIRTYKCGYVVNKLEATAEDYCKALEFLYSNRSEVNDMSNNARRIMESEYSWEHMERRLFTIYNRLV